MKIIVANDEKAMESTVRSLVEYTKEKRVMKNPYTPIGPIKD